MNKSHLLGAVCACTFLFVYTPIKAAVITTASDPALAGATVDNFSAYAIGDSTSVSDGLFTITQIGGETITVTDIYSGLYGVVGRSILTQASSTGISVSFANPVSAFGIHIGASDYDWSITAEAFGVGGGTLGSATVTHNTNGFFLGWADANIGSIVLSPVNSDSVVLDNLHYVETVPIPAALWLFGSGLIGLVGIARRRKTT